MCGIVGLFGKITEPKVETFEEMFQIDVLRGSDSCGVAVVHGDKVDTVKDITWPDELMSTDEYENLIWHNDIREVKAIIAHNRASTRGSVSKKNAHPFTHDHITLVHNGTVWTHKFPGPDNDTDSETICRHIAKSGIDSVWEMLDGAATLVYWDSNVNKLYMVSNGKRPMWFMEWGDTNESIFWASEPWMMVTASMRAGIPYNVKKLWSLDNNKLYEFDYKDGKVVYTSRLLEEFKEPTYKVGRNGYWRGSEFVPYTHNDEWGYTMYGEFDDEPVDPNEDNNHNKNCNCSECCSMRVKEFEKHCESRFQEEGATSNDNSEPFPGEAGYRPADSSTNSGTVLTLASRRRVADLKVNLTNKRVSEDVFKQRYTKGCSCCGEDVTKQFANAVILNYNQNDALCMICAALGEYSPQPGASIPMDMDRGTTVTCH
jgi:predicted glutamine amidotransferase